MNKTSVQLIQTITFKADRRDKECETIIFTKERGAIEAGESDSWHDTALQIPALPPSDLAHCQNIQIKYKILVSCITYILNYFTGYFYQFRVDPSGVGFDLKVEVPIVIGTIPLRSTFPQFQPQTCQLSLHVNQVL